MRCSLSIVLLTLSMTACARTPMLYPVPGIPVPSPPPAPIEEIVLEVEGSGAVWSWLWPASGGTADTAPVLVFFHGNGENLETVRLSGTFAAFAELGYPCLAVDYPGYGRSAGKPSEALLVRSAVVAVERMQSAYPGRPVVVIGWSLGAAVAIQAVDRARADGLVMMSPWTSLAAVGREHFPGWMVGMFARESYDSLELAPSVRVPALVVHGKRDEIIPVGNGREIAAALPAARWVEVSGAGHNDLLARRRVWEELADYLSGF